MKNGTKKFIPKPNISFARQLAKRLVHLTDSMIEFDRLSDGSCEYIVITKDEHELCISFDGSGEMVTDISLRKQVKQVVDHIKVWEV